MLLKCYETWPEALDLKRRLSEDPATAKISSETRGLCEQKLERLEKVQTIGQGMPDSCSRMLIP